MCANPPTVTVYSVCFKESCQFVRSVSGACLVPRAIWTQVGPVVDLFGTLNLQSFYHQEEVANLG